MHQTYESLARSRIQRPTDYLIRFIILPIDAMSLGLSLFFVDAPQIQWYGFVMTPISLPNAERLVRFDTPFKTLSGSTSIMVFALLLTLTTFLKSVFSYSMVINSPRDRSYARRPYHSEKTPDWLETNLTTRDINA